MNIYSSFNLARYMILNHMFITFFEMVPFLEFEILLWTFSMKKTTLRSLTNI